MQEYKLGQWLRNRYKDFLSEDYSEKDIYVRATDVDRTLMSAESNLAGLYPPKAKQIWNQNIPWQPIPIHTTAEKNDNLLAMSKRCDRYDYLLKELLQTPEFRNIQKTNHDLYAYLSRNTGTTVASLESLESIYNILFIESLNNLTLPDWTLSVYPEKMKAWTAMSFAVPTYTPSLGRLKAGTLLNEIFEHFVNGTKKLSQKFLMFSAHDITIANILNSLRVFEYHAPPYSSTVIFELHALNGSLYVNVLYKNSSVPQEIILSNCTFNCPLERFAKILEPIRLTRKQWDEECKLTYFAFLPFTSLQAALIVGCTVLLLVLISSFIIGIICLKKPREKHDYIRLPDEDV